jgi:gas vesicle protein
MKDNSGKILLAMLAGASAGVIAGLMMAPDTGDATRKSVSKWAGKVSKDLEKSLQAGLDEIKNMSGDMMSKAGVNKGGNTGAGGSSAGSTGTSSTGGASTTGTTGTGTTGSTGGATGSTGGAGSTGGTGGGTTGGANRPTGGNA